MTGSLEGLRTATKLSIGLFKDRIPLTKNHLSKVYALIYVFPLMILMETQIQCPISIIHCINDVAYGIEIAKDLRMTLIQLGCQAKLVTEVPGPRCACVTHPDKYVPLCGSC